MYILPSNFFCGALSSEILDLCTLRRSIITVSTITCFVRSATHKTLHIWQDTAVLLASQVRIFSEISWLSLGSSMAGIPFGSTLGSLMPDLVAAPASHCRFVMMLCCGLGVYHVDLLRFCMGALLHGQTLMHCQLLHRIHCSVIANCAYLTLDLSPVFRRSNRWISSCRSK